jgi:nucleotide-binding universal stress UspA family protein
MPSISYQRILVPLDGSPRAECVLPLATALARTHGAELILAHVITKPEMFQRMPLSEEEKALVNQVVARNRREALRYFEQLQTRLSPKPTTLVLESDSVEYTLLDLAETEAVDLVMLAAHGYMGHNGGAYGRLAARFIEHGSVPLYVHQDLTVDEIKPLYAEQMINNLAPKREQCINAYDYAAN